MESKQLLRIDDLQKKTASEVKNHWAAVVREVRSRGSLVVTQYDRPEMVVMDVATYEKLKAAAEAAATATADRHAATIQRLEADFDRRLASLKSPQTKARIAGVMEARGKAKRRPRVGESF
jgi:prevent-host-death family protein